MSDATEARLLAGQLARAVDRLADTVDRLRGEAGELRADIRALEARLNAVERASRLNSGFIGRAAWACFTALAGVLAFFLAREFST